MDIDYTPAAGFVVIYCATCIPTGQAYVGCTKYSAAARWKDHTSPQVSTTPLQKALSEYGPHQFTLKVLCTVPAEVAAVVEGKYIKDLGHQTIGGLNVIGTGWNTFNNTKPKRSQLKKMSLEERIDYNVKRLMKAMETERKRKRK